MSGQKRSQDGADFLAKKIGRRMSDVVLPSLTLTACGSGSSQGPVKIEENSLLREVIEIKNLGLNLAQYKTVNVSDARFAISDGKLFLRDDIQLDFETEEYINIYLNASDSEGIVRKFPLRLEIIDINEAPSNIFIQSNSVTENVEDFSFGGLQILDQDANEEFQIILSDERFEIRGDEVFTAPGVSFNYEEEPQILLDVTAIDKGGISIKRTFIFDVVDINEVPTDIQIEKQSLNENQENISLGSLQILDQDKGEIFSVQFSDTRFELRENELFTAPGVYFDYEAEKEFTVEIFATDTGGNSISKIFLFTITDENEAPYDIMIESASITENIQDFSLGNIKIFDPDINEEFNLFFSDDRFATLGDELIIKPNTKFDYEIEPEIILNITAVDKGGLSIEKTFAFRILDINEAPTQIHIDQLNDYYFNDQVISTNTLIGSVFVIDDALGDNVLEIQGEDADYFIIDGSNLFLKPSILPSEFDKQFLSIELMAYDVELGVELATAEVLNVRLAPVSLDLFTDLEAPITVKDLDRSRSFTAGDEITLQFSAAVDVQSVDIDDFILDEGSLGDAIIRAVTEGESSAGFVITLGQTSQVSEGANLKLEKYSILDEFGRANGVEINFTTPKADNFFNIDLVYSGSEQYSQIFSAAARIWESVIVGDIKDMGSIDDVKIDVTVETIDGPGEILAYASYTLARSENDGGLPYRGYMVFDVNDLADISYAEALDVALHEIAHVLGFGTLWEDFGLISVLEAAYFGTNAVTAYNEAGGQGRFVPLQTEGGEGTAYAHWDEIILTRELMTGYIEDGENYLSAITIAAMEDLGYIVSYSSAEAFLLAPAVS